MYLKGNLMNLGEKSAQNIPLANSSLEYCHLTIMMQNVLYTLILGIHRQIYPFLHIMTVETSYSLDSN